MKAILTLILALALASCSGPGKVPPGASLIWPVSGYVFQGFYGTESTSSVLPGTYYDAKNQLQLFAGLTPFHRGIDIDNLQGSPIVAIGDGRASVYPWDGTSKNFGNCVVIDHGNSLYSLYGHLKEIQVQAGDVSQGQVIGLMGTTGNSTGPHLHLEIRHQPSPSSILLGHFIPGKNGDWVTKGQKIPFVY